MFLKIDSAMTGTINWDDFMGYLLTVDESKWGRVGGAGGVGAGLAGVGGGFGVGDAAATGGVAKGGVGGGQPGGGFGGGLAHKFVRQEDPESAMHDAHRAPIDSLILVPVHGNFSNHNKLSSGAGGHHKNSNDKAGFAYVSGGRDGVINFYQTDTLELMRVIPHTELHKVSG